MRKFLALIPTGIIGMTLLILGFFDIVDSFWTGMGSALLVVSALRMIRMTRYQTNKEYRENVDIAINDERNRYIRSKAWAWAGYLFILICAVATITLHIMGQELLRTVAGGAMCLMLVLYWGAYFIISKKS